MQAIKKPHPRPVGRKGGNPDAMQKRGEPSHNPRGAPPKEHSIANMLREIGKEVVDNHTKRTRLQVVLRQVFQFATRGEAWAVNFIADRTEGKPVQVVAGTNANMNFSPEDLQGKKLEDLPMEQLLALAKRLAPQALEDLAAEEAPHTPHAAPVKPVVPVETKKAPNA